MIRFGNSGGGYGGRACLATSSTSRALRPVSRLSPPGIFCEKLGQLSWLVFLAFVFSFGCASPSTPVRPGTTGPISATNPAPTDLPYRTDSTLTLSSVPKLAETGVAAMES